MIKFKFIILAILLSPLALLSQNLRISGGSEHSVMLCNKGELWAWGRNMQGTLSTSPVLGIDANGDQIPDTDSKFILPKKVYVPDGAEFTQVYAGSAAFNIALSCTGVVYMWGQNENGECGQGTLSPYIGFPIPVVKGQTTGTTTDGTSSGNYLGHVEQITSSTNAGYALMDDGRVVAWGSNKLGQLCQGTISASITSPVYIKTIVGGVVVNITGVSQIDAGDSNILLLVDPDGDGVGTVYSAGGNDYNGLRNGLFIGRDIVTPTREFYAFPVLKSDGSVLDNISAISAMDGGGMAIDATDGTVWAWGQGSWGCLTGTTKTNLDTPRALRVLAGEYEKYSGNGYLNNVIKLTGGRGFSIALTKDGHVLSWGINDYSNGGALGNGSTVTDACLSGPVFVKYNATTVVTDAVDISCGDNWGFLINKKNEYYTWGNNDYGQLGLNSPAIKVTYPTKMAPPCTIEDPCPVAAILPTLTKCPNRTVYIHSGFEPPTGKSALYQYYWYYSSVDLNVESDAGWSILDYPTTAFAIDANMAGFYKVKIETNSANIACNQCKLSVDKVNVIELDPLYYDPAVEGDTLFCVGTTISPNVITLTGGQYQWHKTQVSDDNLGVSSNSAPTTTPINLTDLTLVPAGSIQGYYSQGNDYYSAVYEAWVEDISTYDFTVGRSADVTSLKINDGGNNFKDVTSSLKFTVSEEISLVSIKFDIKAWGSPKYEFTIIGESINKIFSGTGPVGASGEWVSVTAPVDLVLPPGSYIIQHTNNSDGIRVYQGVTPGPWPYKVPNSNGIISYEGSNARPDYPGWFPYYYDWSIVANRQSPCERMKVLLYEKNTNITTCKNPANYTKNISILNYFSQINLCPGNSKLLQTSTHNDPGVTDEFEFAWFKGSVPDISQTTSLPIISDFVNETNSSLLISYDELTGNQQEYTVLVRDAAEPDNSSCWSTTTARVIKTPPPTYTITGGGTSCDAAVNPIKFFFTGSQPYNFFYSINGINQTVVMNYNSDQYVIPNPAPGIYRIVSLQDAYCSAVIDPNISQEVIINQTPNTTFCSTNVLEYCGTDYPDICVEPVINGIYTWSGPITSSTNTVYNATEGTYYVTISKSGENCEQVLGPITIVGNEIPTISVNGGGNYCEGSSPNPLEITVTGGSPNYRFDYSVGIIAFSEIFTKNNNTLNSTIPGIYKPLKITDLNTNCYNNLSGTYTITENPQPVIVINQVQTQWCEDYSGIIDVSTLFSTSDLYTITYELINGDGGSLNGSLFTFTKPGIFTIKFTALDIINGCSASATCDITISENPKVTLQTGYEICKNDSLVLSPVISGGTSPYTYIWTGNEVNLLSSPNVEKPVIKPSSFEGTANISFKVTDANNCSSGESTISILVNPVPDVAFGTNPSQICYNSSPLQLNVSPVPTSNYTFKGTKSQLSSIFNPGIVAPGINTISYTVTNEYGCRNSATLFIDVVTVDPPTVNPPNPRTVIFTPTLGLSDVTVLSATMNPLADQIEWMPETGGTILGTSPEYITGLDESDFGIHNYAVRNYKNINGGKCISDSVIATIVITSCEAISPTVVDPIACVGSATPVTATASAPSQGNKISWFSFDPANMSGASIADLADDSQVFYSNIPTNTEGKEIVYAAEYNPVSDCWSAGTKVTISVVENPSVSINSPSDVCVANGEVEIIVNPLNGTLSASGATAGFDPLEKTWTPQSGIETQTIKFDYLVTKNHGYGVSMVSCSTTVSSSTTAHFVNLPTAENKYWILADIISLPSEYMTATLSGIDNNISWFEDETTTIPAKNVGIAPDGSSLSPDAAALQAEFNSSGNTNYFIKNYYIVEEDNWTCKSNPVNVKLIFSSCPFSQPEVQNATLCMNESIPEITAEAPTNEPVTGWRWYTENGDEIAGANTSNYLPEFSTTIAGEYTYFVMYSATDPLNGQDCWSPTAEVTVTVHGTPQFTDSENYKSFCSSDSPRELNVDLSTEYLALGYTDTESTFSVDGVEYPKGKTIDPSNWTHTNTTVTSYNWTYTVTNEFGCTNSIDLAFDIQNVAVPIVSPNPIISTSSNNPEGLSPKIHTQADVNATVSIFSNEGTLLGQGETFNTGLDANTDIVENYHVTQEINGCLSDSTEVTVIISSDNPVPAPTIVSPTDGKTVLCVYSTVPLLRITPGQYAGGFTSNRKSNFNWYTSYSSKTPVQSDTSTSFDPTNYLKNMTPGSYYFYVSEFDSKNNIEGTRTEFRINVISVLPPMTTTIKSVCEGTEFSTIQAKSVTGGDLLWFDGGESPVVTSDRDADSLTAIATITSGPYTPVGARAAGISNFYAIQRYNGCLSVTATKYSGEVISQSYAPTVNVPDSICNEYTLTVSEIPTGFVNVWEDNFFNTISTANSYKISNLNAGKYTFYVKQTDNLNCTSQRAIVRVTVKSQPNPPIVTSKKQYCYTENQEDIDPIIANGSEIKWYSILNNYNSIINNSSVSESGYTPQLSVLKDLSFRYLFSTQTVNGCESKMATTTYEMLPEMTLSVNDIYMCSDDTEFSNKTFIANAQPWDNANSSITWSKDFIVLTDVSDTDPKTYTIKESELESIVIDPVYGASPEDFVHVNYSVYFKKGECSISTIAEVVIIPRPTRPYTIVNGMCVPDSPDYDITKYAEPFTTLITFGSKTVNWYAEDGITKIGEGSQLPFENLPNYKDYANTEYFRPYVDRTFEIEIGNNQTIECFSEKVQAELQVKIIPSPKLIGVKDHYHAGDNPKLLTAEIDSNSIWSIRTSDPEIVTYSTYHDKTSPPYFFFDITKNEDFTVYLYEVYFLDNGDRCTGVDSALIHVAGVGIKELQKDENEGKIVSIEVINELGQIIEIVKTYNEITFKGVALLKIKRDDGTIEVIKMMK